MDTYELHALDVDTGYMYAARTSRAPTFDTWLQFCGRVIDSGHHNGAILCFHVNDSPALRTIAFKKAIAELGHDVIITPRGCSSTYPSSYRREPFTHLGDVP